MDIKNYNINYETLHLHGGHADSFQSGAGLCQSCKKWGVTERRKEFCNLISLYHKGNKKTF